ncbi:MAG: PspC domain-containing protein [Saprospiraceae bacterium]|jgi:phage shock protein PspC (stress-responsive transcriptional regulator)
MNKTFNINLGGYPFTIDDDAFEHLKQYTDALRKHFQTYEGADEIISDIESRMAELFNNRLENRSILNINDVQAAIARMGTPEDFGADALFEDDLKYGKSESKYNYKTGKRLYINPDDKVIAGVCSGLSAYFGVEDPVWLRIAFALLAFGSVGVIIPVYIVLMIILPKAETASQKLEMRGEPIDVNSIAKAVENGIDNISNTITQLTDEFTKKKK